MPNQRAVALYEVGVRLTQCLRVFPAGADGNMELDSSYRYSLLHRLDASLDWLFNGSDTDSTTDRRCAQIMEQIFTLDIRTAEEAPESFNALLVVLQRRVDRWLKGTKPSDKERQWFHFGLAIADGTGGPPAERLFRSDTGQLSSERHSEAYWDRRDETGVDELLVQLDSWEDFPGIVRLFPKYNELRNSEDILPGTPDLLWGWIALEVGLQRLRETIEVIESTRRRRGSPPNPMVKRRNKWIIDRRKEHPDLSPKKLLGLLTKENAADNLGYELNINTVQNAIKRNPPD